MKKAYVLGASIIIISLLLASCNFDLTTGKIEAEQTEESLSIAKEVQGLVEQLKYNDARKLLEDNYEVFQKDDKLIRAYGTLEYHIYENYEKAQQLIETAIQLNPRDYDNYLELGNVYRVQGNYDRAIYNYKKAVKHNDKYYEGLWSPENSRAYMLIGNCYLELSDKENAIKAYEKATEYNPYNIEVNSSLHKLYVDKEEYDKAFQIWRTDNLVEKNEENIYEQISIWNGQYKNTLENNSNNKHYELGKLYSDLVLYDEAKIEYEKALSDENEKKEVEEKLYEINAFLSFRDELEETLDEHYRKRCINGVREDLELYRRLEPAYKKVSILFEGLEQKKGSSDYWIKELDKAIEEKFNIRIEYIHANSSMLGCHFGRIVDNSSMGFSQWGKKIDLRVVTLKNMVSNGLDIWRSMGKYGVGGWGGSLTEIVRVVQNQGNDGIIAGLSLYNEDFSDNILKEAAEYDQEIGEKGPLDLYYSAVLSSKFSIRQMEIEVDKARQLGVSEDDINKFLYNKIDKDYLVKTTIYAHEVQHSIDSKYGASNSWNGENEYRPKLAQLAYGEMHFINLNSFYTPMIGSIGTNNTHINANTQIIKDIVQHVYDNSERYPEIDIDKNILAQLVKLDEEDLKEIGISIFEKKYPGFKYQ